MKFLRELYDMEQPTAAPSHLAANDGSDNPIAQNNEPQDTNDNEEGDSINIEISALARIFTWIKDDNQDADDIHQLLSKIIDHKDHVITLDDFNSLVGEDDHEGHDEDDMHPGHHLQNFTKQPAPSDQQNKRDAQPTGHDEY